MGRAMRKRVFGHMRTAKAQISLHICAVWSGPSLSAYRIIGNYRMYQVKSNARMRLCACVGWIWISAIFAKVRRHIFAWRAPHPRTHSAAGLPHIVAKYNSSCGQYVLAAYADSKYLWPEWIQRDGDRGSIEPHFDSKFQFHWKFQWINLINLGLRIYSKYSNTLLFTLSLSILVLLVNVRKIVGCVANSIDPDQILIYTVCSGLSISHPTHQKSSKIRFCYVSHVSLRVRAVWT